MNELILEIKNLSFKYGSNYILRDVDLDIYKGDYIALIGSNGAGKSTFVKLILNQLNADEGVIKFHKDLDYSNIGYVPQIEASTNLQFPITVFELVSLALFSNEKRGFKKMKKNDRDKVIEALKIVNMQDYDQNLYSELSGGQRQRVLIAKTLVRTPKFLILDEPMTGIDKESRKSLFKLLDHINKSHGVSILMITHDLAQVRENVNKIYMVEDHKIRRVMK